MTTHKLPSFFFDYKRGYEKEIFIDYFLSWTLRCAVDDIEEKKNSKINETVQQQSKYVLLNLLKYDEKFKGLTLSNTTIKSVETEKQWEQTDLFCVVDFMFDGEKHNCILVFENKMYSPLKAHQLRKYSKKVKKHSDKKNFEGYSILKFFIHSYPNFAEDETKLYGFKPIHISEISEELKMHTEKTGTGNALFDEFWYNYI